MNHFLSEGEPAPSNLSIYDKLKAALGELGENIPLVIALLPRDVEAALLSTEDDELIREIWYTYLERETSYFGGPNSDTVSEFQALHGHRYAKAVDASISRI